MRIIGLTGGIASGKSTVSGYLLSIGAKVIDADRIARNLTAQGGVALERIREAFGGGVFLEDGALNRAALGTAVFADAEKRERLNAILHPLVYAQMQRELDAYRIQGETAVVVDVPLLLETGMQGMVNSVWVVSCPKDAQLQRLICRDGLTREEAKRRIKSQMPLEKKLEFADEVVDSTQPLERMLDQINALWQKELRWAKNEKQPSS